MYVNDLHSLLAPCTECSAKYHHHSGLLHPPQEILPAEIRAQLPDGSAARPGRITARGAFFTIASITAKLGALSPLSIRLSLDVLLITTTIMLLFSVYDAGR